MGALRSSAIIFIVYSKSEIKGQNWLDESGDLLVVIHE